MHVHQGINKSYSSKIIIIFNTENIYSFSFLFSDCHPIVVSDQSSSHPASWICHVQFVQISDIE